MCERPQLYAAPRYSRSAGLATPSAPRFNPHPQRGVHGWRRHESKLRRQTARRAFSYPILGPMDSVGRSASGLPALSSAEFHSGIDLTDVNRGKESRAARLSDGNSAIVELATRRRGPDALKGI